MHEISMIYQNKLQLPISKMLIDFLSAEANSSPNTLLIIKAITFNFNDAYFCSINGGFPPVEIRIICCDNRWFFDYINCFKWVNDTPNKLIKTCHFDWQKGQVIQQGKKTLSEVEAQQQFIIWQHDFLSCTEIGIYTASLLWES